MQAVARHVWVRGRVQGVGYRAWTERTANALGLTGWVRNLADGRVEMWLEGPEAKVEDMVTRAKRGPTYAEVSEVHVETVACEGKRAFEVRRDG